MSQAIEHRRVAKEARDADAAKIIERRPFLAVVLQIIPIRPDIVQLQNPYAAGDAFTGLATDLAAARPAQPQRRQRPLQKRDAGLIIHRARRRSRQVDESRVSSRVPLSNSVNAHLYWRAS